MLTMHKWLGLQEPPEKKRKTDKKIDHQKNYANQNFNESWRTVKETGEQRSWLQFEKDTKSMFCSVCVAHAVGKEQESGFVQGTAKTKLDSITKHESSECQENAYLHSICLIVACA